jgi:hypothetical protein
VAVGYNKGYSQKPPLKATAITQSRNSSLYQCGTFFFMKTRSGSKQHVEFYLLTPLRLAPVQHVARLISFLVPYFENYVIQTVEDTFCQEAFQLLKHDFNLELQYFTKGRENIKQKKGWIALIDPAL